MLKSVRNFIFEIFAELCVEKASNLHRMIMYKFLEPYFVFSWTSLERMFLNMTIFLDAVKMKIVTVMLDEGVLTERLNVCLSSPLFCVVVLITSVRVTAVHQRRAHPIHRLPRHRCVTGSEFEYRSTDLVLFCTRVRDYLPFLDAIIIDRSEVRKYLLYFRSHLRH